MYGLIAQYNLDQHEGVHNLFCLHMEGFVVLDCYHRYPRFLKMVLSLMKERKMAYVEDIDEGLENAPRALIGLFLDEVVIESNRT